MNKTGARLLLAWMALTPAQLQAQSDPLKDALAVVSTAYKRVASVPASAADLDTWAKEYVAAKDLAAKKAVLKKVATAATTNDTFYSKTVMNFADPQTNEGEELQVTNLTDYTATIVGFVRDDLDHRRILYDDIMYVPSPNIQGIDPAVTYSSDNNTVYEQLEQLVINGEQPLASNLTQVTQSATTGLPIQAGEFTLRGFGSVFYNDGTNRAPLRYTFINYLCTDMEELSDVTRSEIGVRRDVDRTPGGDGAKFRSECVGCHAGMDPMTKAFAYLDYAPNADDPAIGNITYGTNPVPKVNRNFDTFPAGASVDDDAWVNLWYEGSNENFGWSKNIKSGNGPKSWGQSMSETEAFPKCMAKRAYKVICLKDPTTAEAKSVIDSLGAEFVKNGYKMKSLFIDTAVECVSKLKF